MNRNKKKYYTVAKWLFMVAAYGYLILKLANVAYWNELKLSFLTITFNRLILLLSVFIIMPVNWGLEARKWQILTSSMIKLSFTDAFKSVLAGLNTGFITPSRFGDFAGRIIYFPPNLRLAGTLLSFVNGFIQTFVVTVFGLISAYFYSLQFHTKLDYSKYILSVVIILVILAGIYFLFPKILKNIKNKKWVVKLQSLLQSLSELNIKTLVYAFAISALRFGVFSFQYYLLLCFFKIELSPIQALIGIPTMYLLITYVPTLAASEAAVRASIAVLILSVFSKNEIAILLTGIVIWLINYILPMLFGSFFIIKTNARNNSSLNHQ